MADPHISAEVFPVWEYINNELHERRWSKERLAKEMGGDENHNLCALDFLQRCLLEPRLLLGEDIAAGLSRAFGTSKELWLNLDQSCKAAMAAGRKYNPPEAQDG